MKFCFFLLCFCLGLASCYDALDAGMNAAYLQSNQSSDASSSPQTQTDQDVQPRDTVYLKDGSIIHGFIVEEQPGVSLQIKTKSGNVYSYQMADVAKITHAVQAAGDNSGGGDVANGNSSSAGQ
ncbi:MAG TPA: hypothetical protein VN963_04945 [bacterium]|nr:hypothetical protein [bacterium]